MATTQRPRVVIIGAGFGGLATARALANQSVDVLLIDRNNFHLFTPLLYQVATCGLEAEEIAYPVRGIIRGKGNIEFLMGEVEEIDAVEKCIFVRTNGEVKRKGYEYLVVAAGSVSNYFNNDSVALYSFDLKDLDDSVELRNHILRLYERANWTDNEEKRDAMTTVVVVGGGPTGLETAGAMQELYDHVLSKEFPKLKFNEPRVILVEAMDTVLRPYPEPLQKSALKQLSSLGVEVILGNAVSDVRRDGVVLQDGREISTHTLVWSAGVKASPLAEMLNVPLARGGRVPVKPTTEVINLDGVYVVGDMAYLEDENGMPYPQLIPVAQQQGALTAENIMRRIAGQEEQVFEYQSRGTMATIGRSRAVAWIFHRFMLTGYFAWAAWLVLHIMTLMGFRNRVKVFVNWVWNYFTYDHAVRIILDSETVVVAGQNKTQPERELEAH